MLLPFRKISIAIGILLLPSLLFAQHYYFRHYQVENGLSNNTVHCSIQDRNGFMWFGTKEGLNRFDGYRFKHFTFEDSNSSHPGDNRVFNLFNDPKGRLLVGARKGLYQYDEYKEKMVRLKGSPDEVSSIQMDNDGILWFLSWDNIYRYDSVSGKVERFPMKDHFPATWICKDEKGRLWFCTSDGYIYEYVKEKDSFRKYDVFGHSPAPSSRWIIKLVAAGDGRLFVATTSQGLKRFNTGNGEYEDVLTRTPDNISLFIRDVLPYNNKEYWCATESGIFLYDTLNNSFINLRKKFLDPYSLSDNAVYTLCKDSEGGVWAGTYFGGVNYFPKQYSLFNKYYPDLSSNSISGSAVREICADGLNNIWIGTEDAGLNKLDPATGKIVQFHPGGGRQAIAYSNIHGLVVDSLDLWIGTFEHGLDRLDIRTGLVKRHYDAGPGTQQLKSNFIVTLMRTRSGAIYVATSTGLFLYRKHSDDFERVKEIPENTFVAALLEDHNGTIWVGTYGRGLHYFNSKTGEKGSFEDYAGGLIYENITAILEDRRNNLWLCTEGGGISLLNQKKEIVKKYTIENGLPSNYAFKALEDDAGNIWISTSRGLAKLNPFRNQIITYTRANGLLNDQFNYNSGFKDKDGRLYFGSIKGMISFRPADFTENLFDPSVYITGLQVHNRELGIDSDSSSLNASIIHTSKLTLPWNQSSFSIDFAALSYTSPEKTEYRYKLEGLEKEWTHLSTNRKVYFTNVSPGTYRFLVQAASDGRWNKTPRLLEIRVLPPFWATKWAYAFYILIGAAIAYYVFRSYHRYTQNKKEKEIYEAKIDFFTNVAHEIKTPLTLIKGPLENLSEQAPAMPAIQEDVLTMEKNTNRLITLVQQILDFRQIEMQRFSLEFTKLNISSIVEDAFLFFKPLAKKRNLIYELHLPESPPYAFADEEALNKIFSNLFGNAVKYGAKEVHITLLKPERNADELIIEVKSDGYKIPVEMREKIFEPFFRLRENHKQKGTGIGLALARSLAELHQGNLYLKETANTWNIFIFHLPIGTENA